MIRGMVVSDEPCVEIEVSGPLPSSQRLIAVVDSGYTGHLTLPDHAVIALQLPSLGQRQGILADGSSVVLPVFAATVEWHGRAKHILVSQSGGAPLIGMRLLFGSKITMEVFDGGKVLIEELPGSP